MRSLLSATSLGFLPVLILMVSSKVLAGGSEYVPVRGDVRSATSGSWSSPSTWERYDGTAWIPASASPDSGSGVITVRAGHTVTISSSLVYDQVIVESGAQVVVAAGVSHTLTDGPGIDLTIDGTWLNQGATWTIVGSARWAVNDGGVFIHNTSAGIATPLSKSILSRLSTFIYRGGPSLVPASTFSGRTYGHLSLESLGGAFTLSAAGSSALTISGDLTIGAGVRWNTGGFSGSITIQGATTISGEWTGSGNGNLGVHTFAGPFTLSSGGSYTLATTGPSQGNLVFKGDIASEVTFTTPPNRAVELSGLSTQTIDAPAEIVLANGAVAFQAIVIPAGTTIEIGSQKNLILRRDINLSGIINGTDSGSSVLVADSNRLFTNNGSILVAVKFDSGRVERWISGTGVWNTLIVESGCTVRVSGNLTLTGSGNPLTVRGVASFEPGSSIAYRGSSRQDIPPLSCSDLIIDNPEGVSLTGLTTVNGRLIVRLGSLRTGVYSLRLGSGAALEETGSTPVYGTVVATRRVNDGKKEMFGNIGIEIQPVSPFGQDVSVTRRTDSAVILAGAFPIRRFFTLCSGSPLREANLSFQYAPSELNSAKEGNLQFYASADSGRTWARRGGNVDTVAHRVSFSGDCSYSFFTLAEPYPIPQIASVSPGLAEQGSSIDLLLAGSGFMQGESILSFSGTGVRVISMIVRNSTSVEATIVVDATAPMGPRDIMLVTPGGKAHLVGALEIVKPRNPVPLLASIAPTTGARLESLAVTLHGGGFVDGLTTVSLGDQVVVSPYVLDPTLLTVNAIIGAGAGLGPHDVTVTNPGPGGGSSTMPQAFTVVNPAPQIVSVSPAKAARGESIEIIISGANFIPGVTSLSCGPGIVVDTPIVFSQSEIRARIRIEFSVSRGARTLTVSNQEPGGGRSTLAGGFTITDPPPKVVAISPSTLSRGASASIDIRGAGFVEQGLILSLGSGVIVESVSTIDSCRLKATVSVARWATPGPRDLILANRGPDGESCILPRVMAVENPAPVLSSVSPAVGVLGQSMDVTLAGEGFFADATSPDFGPGICKNSCACDSSGRNLLVNISISSDAALGQRGIKVTNNLPGGGGAVLSNAFVVVNPVPTLLAIKPASGGRGQVLDVFIMGTNFVQGATSVSLNPGVMVDSVAVLSPVSMSVRARISPDAIVGARTLAVTNPPPGGGTARMLHVFNVENGGPTIDRVEPAIAWRGERVNIAIHGSNFYDGITRVLLDSEIIIESAKTANLSLIEASLFIPSDARPGSRDVCVSTPGPGGGTAKLQNAFAVENPPPLLESVAPASGASGEALKVILTGARFHLGVTTISFGDGVEVESLSVMSSKTIEARIAVLRLARAGPRAVTVTNAGPGGGHAELRDAFVVTSLQVSPVESFNAAVPAGPVLVGVHPNPFNHSAIIRYGLSERSAVRILVRNILGVEILELSNAEQAEGFHDVRWTSTNEPSGVYFVQLFAESVGSKKHFTASKKIVLLK